MQLSFGGARLRGHAYTPYQYFRVYRILNMLSLCAVVLASFLSVTLCTSDISPAEDCSRIFPPFPALFNLQDGIAITTDIIIAIRRYVYNVCLSFNINIK